MNFGDSSHQIIKMPEWIWSSWPDIAPLSRKRVKVIKIHLVFCVVLKKDKNLKELHQERKLSRLILIKKP